MSLLKIVDLQKVFCKDCVCVAKNISFEVNEGEIFTLMGKSGSGKSSLLRMICGFEKPDAGKIILGNNILFCSDDKINIESSKRNLSMVFQNYALFPHFTVKQNILFGYEKQGKQEIDKLLKNLDIESIKNRYPHEISGGQQQRVALARSLIRKPKLLLLDEPFSSIDGAMRSFLRDELHQMIKNFGITAMFVTHDKEDAFHMSDRMALISCGDILQIGSIKDLYDHPKNKEVATLLGKINVISVDEKELVFRPNALDINENGKFEALILETIYHGFYYVHIAKTNDSKITIYSDKGFAVNDVIKYDMTPIEFSK